MEILSNLITGIGLGVFAVGISSSSNWLLMLGGGIILIGIDMLITVKIKNSKND